MRPPLVARRWTSADRRAAEPLFLATQVAEFVRIPAKLTTHAQAQDCDRLVCTRFNSTNTASPLERRIALACVWCERGWGMIKTVNRTPTEFRHPAFSLPTWLPACSPSPMGR